jgi:hypothetical protein
MPKWRVSTQPLASMTAVKEYAYIIARSVVGVLLILSGAIVLGRSLQVLFHAGPLRYLFGWGNLYTFLVNAVLDIIPIVLGVAVLRQRARALATAYCLLGVATETLRFLFRYHFGLEHLLYLAVYTAGTIFLLIPRPRISVRNAPAEPDEANWRVWLLASLQGEGRRLSVESARGVSDARVGFHKHCASLMSESGQTRKNSV